MKSMSHFCKYNTFFYCQQGNKMKQLCMNPKRKPPLRFSLVQLNSDHNSFFFYFSNLAELSVFHFYVLPDQFWYRPSAENRFVTSSSIMACIKHNKNFTFRFDFNHLAGKIERNVSHRNFNTPSTGSQWNQNRMVICFINLSFQ